MFPASLGGFSLTLLHIVCSCACVREVGRMEAEIEREIKGQETDRDMVTARGQRGKGRNQKEED